MRAVKLLCGAAVAMMIAAPAAHADEWNKRTYLTFSGPVGLPGKTLPAGTYTFEVANPDTTRHVIRVTEKDTNRPIGLFMTIPADRLDPPDENLIMFAERPAGQPQAIQMWFYPGDRIGEEFVYPKSQAVAIAKANHRTVLATEDTGSANANASEADQMSAMKNARVGRVDENGQMTEEAKPATTAENTTPTPAAPATTSNPAAQTAQAETPQANTAPHTAVGTSGQAQPAANANRRTELPRTASNLTLYELLSLSAIAGAFAVRTLRRAAARA